MNPRRSVASITAQSKAACARAIIAGSPAAAALRCDNCSRMRMKSCSMQRAPQSSMASRMSFAALTSPTARSFSHWDRYRKTAAEAKGSFGSNSSARPRILGALLDGVVRGLQKLPQIHLQNPPRMADFALWATGTFMRAYETNRQAAIDDIIEADPVATLVREIMAERDTLAGQASDLLQAGLGRKKRPHQRAGRKIPAHSPLVCVAARPSCEPPALRFPSAAKAPPAAGSFEWRCS
jgi:hypothetical protein